MSYPLYCLAQPPELSPPCQKILINFSLPVWRILASFLPPHKSLRLLSSCENEGLVLNRNHVVEVLMHLVFLGPLLLTGLSSQPVTP